MEDLRNANDGKDDDGNEDEALNEEELYEEDWESTSQHEGNASDGERARDSGLPQPRTLSPDPIPRRETTLEREQDRLARLQQRSAVSMQPKPGKHGMIPSSTINYGQYTAEAAHLVGIQPESLASRKPHTTLGNGSSGTDHERADGNAARDARDQVQDKIEKKTGVRMDEKTFIKQSNKEQQTRAAQSEKKQAILQQKIEVLEADRADYKRWLALLIPDSERQRQESLGNTVPTKMAKLESKLKAKAKAKGWPLAWKPELLQELCED